MTVICNVKENHGKILDGGRSAGYTHPGSYLRHCSLKNCRLPLGIQYRIVVGIILKLVIIWNFKKVFKVYNFRLVAGSRGLSLLFQIHSCGISNVRFFWKGRWLMSATIFLTAAFREV